MNPRKLRSARDSAEVVTFLPAPSSEIQETPANQFVQRQSYQFMNLLPYVKARYPILYLVTPEEGRAEPRLHQTQSDQC